MTKEKDYITVKDIAKKLGLHHSTVSRALRDYPDISEQTKEKVRKLAKEMNYTPNIVAQSLKTNTSRLIGIIVPEILHNFFSSAISGIENAVYGHGYVPIVLQSNESTKRENLNIEAMITNRVAGLIVSVSQTTFSDEPFQKIIDKSIPVVFFDRVIDGLEAGYILSDDENGAFDGVEYLIQQGYKKIAHFSGPQDLTICKNRVRGYKKALQKHSLPIDDDLITYGTLYEEHGYNTIAKMIANDNLPDAIFAVNDPVAMGAYKKIKEVGLKMPDDIAVLGFSNTEIGAYLDPALSTIDQFPQEMGGVAARTLLEHMDSGKIEQKVKVQPTKVIRRGTT